MSLLTNILLSEVINIYVNDTIKNLSFLYINKFKFLIRKLNGHIAGAVTDSPLNSVFNDSILCYFQKQGIV